MKISVQLLCAACGKESPSLVGLRRMKRGRLRAIEAGLPDGWHRTEDGSIICGECAGDVPTAPPTPPA
jgi:hypothetical protein